jgi:2-oxoglutarate ferredoxin oxidoreductase subunit alpha
MALGASFAGVRAMTGTSGGGFALMVEGVSLAAMTETPVVIALGQRPGPATGLPTRTEQGDLLFALHAGHGEFPKVILAPGDPAQALHLTKKAFDLTEKYQVPAFILFDTYLADTTWTYDRLSIDDLAFTDYRLRGNAFQSVSEYKRHAFTKGAASPLAVPGEATHVVVTDSDEHDEAGHIVEDAETRVRMVRKRLLQKLPLLRQEIDPPVLYGDQNPEIVIAGWGSLYGLMKEAVDALSSTKRIAMLHFSQLYPFPVADKSGYLRVLEEAKLTICVEQNASSQFARLLRAETGFVFHSFINRYDGRPFTQETLLGELNDRL